MTRLEDFHDFFVAAAGVAGALIGLLFVAISVAPQRVTDDAEDPTHRIRAAAALTAFTNALTISLLALMPSTDLGTAAIIVALVGLFFVTASLLSLIRNRHEKPFHARDASFLAGLMVLFAFQLVAGIRLAADGGSGPISTIAIVTLVCFLVGIARSWELVGAPSFRLRSEVAATLRQHFEEPEDHGHDPSDAS